MTSAVAFVCDDDRKIFVGGLNTNTSEKEISDYFGHYGELERTNLSMFPNGQSRGFAHVIFKSSDAIDKVMATREHYINGKKLDVKKAKPLHGKIFVSGLNSEISDDQIKNYFSKFGTLVELEMPFDKIKNQRKGHCYITFDSRLPLNELLKTPTHTIAGCEVKVRIATHGEPLEK